MPPSGEPPETVDDLVGRAAGGDQGALEALLRAHAPQVCASIEIRPRWRRSFDPDDILQITSMEAILRIESLKEHTVEGFRSWLGSIARNNLLDAIRGLEAQKRTPPERRVTHDQVGRSGHTLMAQLRSDDPSASAVLRGREEVDALRHALAMLPPIYRAVVVQVDIEERPVQEVADEMGRSTGAVYMLRVRAHDRLRELLMGRAD